MFQLINAEKSNANPKWKLPLYKEYCPVVCNKFINGTLRNKVFQIEQNLVRNTNYPNEIKEKNIIELKKHLRKTTNQI